jgi:hypothetical protein
VSFARYIFNSLHPALAGPAVAEKLSVVILYEQLAHVGKAAATCLSLVRELAGEFTPDFRLWRIDLAVEPGFEAEAERDIADAQVIIMAVNGCQPCPPKFQRWMGGAGHGGGPPPHAIIALMEASDESDPPAESWDHVLRHTATQIHSEIFVCDPPGSVHRTKDWSCRHGASGRG